MFGCNINKSDVTIAKVSNTSKERSRTSCIVDKKSALWRYIDTLTVIDTHEHIDREIDFLGSRSDVFDMMIPYVIDNLQSAGMTKEEMQLIRTKEADFNEKWDAFYKYYPNIKNTTYFLALSSRDGQHTVALAFEQAIWASSNVGDDRACFHLFPWFGRIDSGESVSVNGKFYILKGGPEEALDRFKKDFQK